MQSSVDYLLDKTTPLQAELLPALELAPSVDSPRTRQSNLLALIAFEHGTAALDLYRLRKFTSAISLLRLQYEALVRSAWVLYAAISTQVERLEDEERLLTSNPKLPGIPEMISALDGKAPDTLVRAFIEMRDSSWRPLSSYVHSGIHAVRWVETGVPAPLVEQLVRLCNGLLVYTAIHLAELADDKRSAFGFAEAALQYNECLPEFRR